MDNKIVKLIFEKKMSDAKDLIDQTLSSKLAGIISEGLDTTVNEKLDPVGKEDKDVDNDGDTDDTDSYLLNRRKAIGKAIAKKGGKTVEPVKEEEKKENKTKLYSGEFDFKKMDGLGKDIVKAFQKRVKDKSGARNFKKFLCPLNRGESYQIFFRHVIPKYLCSVCYTTVYKSKNIFIFY